MRARREQVTSSFPKMADSGITDSIQNISATSVMPGMERPRHKINASGGLVPRSADRLADRRAVSNAVLTSARSDEPVQETDGGGTRFSAPDGVLVGGGPGNAVLPAYARRPTVINAESGQAMADEDDAYLQRQLAKVHGSAPGVTDYYQSRVRQVDDTPFGSSWENGQ